jgi:hypothetical protein
MSQLQVLQLAGRKLSSRLPIHLARQGITARLIAAFVAVAVLVLAANVMFVRTVLITKSTTTYQAASERDQRNPASAHSAVADRRRVDTAMLRAAINRYRTAVRARIESSSAQIGRTASNSPPPPTCAER